MIAPPFRQKVTFLATSGLLALAFEAKLRPHAIRGIVIPALQGNSEAVNVPSTNCLNSSSRQSESADVLAGAQMSKPDDLPGQRVKRIGDNMPIANGS